MQMTKTHQRELARLETLNIPDEEKRQIRWHIEQAEIRRQEKLAANHRTRVAKAMINTIAGFKVI